MYTKTTTLSLIVLCLFITTIIAVNTHGLNNRVFAPDSNLLVIDSSDQAYRIWENKKVKGRILLLFDNYPHSKGRINYNGEPRLTESNFVEFAVFNNVLRRVYYIVPDSQWGTFRKQEAMTNPFREAISLEQGLYLFNINGIPLIALPLSSLPHFPEKPLVYINSAVFNQRQILEILGQKNISSDCIISLQGGAR